MNSEEKSKAAWAVTGVLALCDLNGNDIYITECDDRYWIYTNLLGDDHDFTFHVSSEDPRSCTVAITPVELETDLG